MEMPFFIEKRSTINYFLLIIVVTESVTGSGYMGTTAGNFSAFPQCPNYTKPILGGNFRFCNCGIHNRYLPLVFHNFSILPDPVIMNWPTFNVTVTANVTLGETIGNDTGLDLSLSARLIRPGISEFELCDILPSNICFLPNVCDVIRKELHNITGCPIGKTKGPMPIPPLTKAGITSPPFHVKGNFVLQITLKEAGRNIACLQFEVCFNDCIPLRKDEL